MSNEELNRQLENTTQSVAEAKEIIKSFEERSAAQFKATSNFN